MYAILLLKSKGGRGKIPWVWGALVGLMGSLPCFASFATMSRFGNGPARLEMVHLLFGSIIYLSKGRNPTMWDELLAKEEETPTMLCSNSPSSMIKYNIYIIIMIYRWMHDSISMDFFGGTSAFFAGSVNSHAPMSPQSFLVCTAQLRLQLNNCVNVQDMDLAAWCMGSSHMDGWWKFKTTPYLQPPLHGDSSSKDFVSKIANMSIMTSHGRSVGSYSCSLAPSGSTIGLQGCLCCFPEHPHIQQVSAVEPF